eukprot:1160761-Pelagomonas_calceolata.AAC.1
MIRQHMVNAMYNIRAHAQIVPFDVFPLINASGLMARFASAKLPPQAVSLFFHCLIIDLMDMFCVAGTVEQAKQPNYLAKGQIPL